jgi:hypothetical protein
LSSGYEKKRLYLKDVRQEREDGTKKEGLPSAVELKGNKNLRREVTKQRKVHAPARPSVARLSAMGGRS